MQESKIKKKTSDIYLVCNYNRLDAQHAPRQMNIEKRAPHNDDRKISWRLNEWYFFYRLR